MASASATMSSYGTASGWTYPGDRSVSRADPSPMVSSATRSAIRAIRRPRAAHSGPGASHATASNRSGGSARPVAARHRSSSQRPMVSDSGRHGAPVPVRELPVRLERMIHFVPPHVEKVTAKVPDPTVGALLPEFSDEFEGAELDEAWTIVGTPQSNPEVVGGALVWPTQAGDLRSDDHAAVLLRDAPEGTYTVETKVHLPLGTGPRGYERAGLLVWGDRVNSLHVAPTSTGTTRQAFLWVGPAASPWPNAIQLGPSADTLWLRMRHTIHPETGEHLFRAATSRDGEHWIWGAVWHLPADAEPRVGLVAMGGEGVTATFDYLRVYGP